MAAITEASWHAMAPAAAAEALATSPRRGLTAEEAAVRCQRYGTNALEQVGARRGWKIFLTQFTDFLVLVLIGACLVSAFLGEFVDAAAIFAIVILNGVLGFVQEHRAEKSLHALRELAAPKATLVRDGRECVRDSREVVPGDVVRLRAGDKIPADVRILEEHSLEVDEAALTGESLAVAKEAEVELAEDMPLADRRNMAYSGTVVTYGRADGAVVATGMDTELGRIAALVQEVGLEQTPLQQRLARLGKFLVWAVLALCAVVFVVGWLRGVPAQHMFLTAVSLAVAAIPEGLPAVVTIALALGVQRMVKRHALVRRLSSVETLGSTTVICSDKTGTLTQNKMVARRTYVNGREVVRPEAPDDVKGLLTMAFLCTGDFIGAATTGRCELDGERSNPTEAALVEAALGAGVDPAELMARYAFEEEVPFDSRRKRMTAVFGADGARLAITKGAPEILLELCSAVLEGESARPLTPDGRAALEGVNADLAARGLRVLAVATRELAPSVEVSAAVERELTFRGFVALEDPPRPEVPEAVRRCRLAHITPIMVTGDHKATAAAIAAEVGIMEEAATALTGSDLDALSEEELVDELEDARVLARVTPEHKLRVVRALRARGAVVAMTGDGVNDAPALKEADIGVAMGITGTDVSKEASDMILTDDNFATIVAAVEEGRNIYANIKKDHRDAGGVAAPAGPYPDSVGEPDNGRCAGARAGRRPAGGRPHHSPAPAQTRVPLRPPRPAAHPASGSRHRRRHAGLVPDGPLRLSGGARHRADLRVLGADAQPALPRVELPEPDAVVLRVGAALELLAPDSRRVLVDAAPGRGLSPVPPTDFPHRPAVAPRLGPNARDFDAAAAIHGDLQARLRAVPAHPPRARGLLRRLPGVVAPAPPKGYNRWESSGLKGRARPGPRPWPSGWAGWPSCCTSTSSASTPRPTAWRWAWRSARGSASSRRSAWRPPWRTSWPGYSGLIRPGLWRARRS
jgi:Ca2+-transporting ATPase